MANRAPVRDYLYVSTQELERLAGELPEPTLAPGLSLADAPEATVMEVMAEVEGALRDEQRIRHVSDADLSVGQWFESSTVQMAYGVQAARRIEDNDSAVFVGKIDEHSARAESSLLLAGAAEFLQAWRPIKAQDISGGMSYPSALFSLLASLSARKGAAMSVLSEVELPGGDRRVPSHRGTTPGEEPREEQWLAVGYPIAQAQSSFGQRGFFPITFLARAVKIVEFESRGLPGRWIVGTPLWVAEQVPV